MKPAFECLSVIVILVVVLYLAACGEVRFPLCTEMLMEVPYLLHLPALGRSHYSLSVN